MKTLAGSGLRLGISHLNFGLKTSDERFCTLRWLIRETLWPNESNILSLCHSCMELYKKNNTIKMLNSHGSNLRSCSLFNLFKSKGSYLRFWSCGWCWRWAWQSGRWQNGYRAPSCTPAALLECLQEKGEVDPSRTGWTSAGTAPSGSAAGSACSCCRPAPAVMDPPPLHSHLPAPELGDSSDGCLRLGCSVRREAAGAAGWKTVGVKSWSCRWFPVERPKCSPWEKNNCTFLYSALRVICGGADAAAR